MSRILTQERTKWHLKVIFATCLAICHLDASALEVKNGHFYQNNERIKLWGVHLSPGLSVANYNTSDALVPRIREMGFNAVSIWGIWEMFIDGVPQSKKGDDSPMDRLDYLVYKCREAGLYVWLATATRIPRVKIDDYVSGPVDSDDARKWYDTIQRIQTHKPDSRPAQYTLYLDDNLQKVKLRFVTDLLTHTNPYTNKPYKNQDGLLLYLSDENGFVSNAAANIRHPKNNEQYLNNLLEDMVTERKGGTEAIFRIAGEWHKSIVGRIKKLSPNMPVNVDTSDRAKLFNLYSCMDADFCAYGVGGHQNSSGSTMLFEPPLFNDKNGRSREFKIKGKPWIMYTGNALPPAEYRAEWPLRVAAFANYQDADGVFFWNWALGFRDNKKYSAMPVYDPKRDTDISTDEILLSTSRLAGDIFLNGYLPTAREPITFTYGRRALLSWQYGYDWQATQSFSAVQKAAYVSGANVKLDMDADIISKQDRPIDQEIANPLIWANPDEHRKVIWDWEKGQLTIDTPEAKAMTGFFGKEQHFNGGISLTNISQDFVSFALASGDGKPIVNANSLSVSLVSKSHNMGFRRIGKDNFLSMGSTPVIVERVSGLLSLPHNSYDVTKIDFAGNVFDRSSIHNGKLYIDEEEPIFIIKLHKTNDDR